MKLIAIFSLFFSWALACSSGGSDTTRYETAPGYAEVPGTDQRTDAYAEESGQLDAVEAKVIRDGRMQVNVKDVGKAKIFVDAVLKKYDARTSGEQFENNDYQSTYYIRIRVPSERLDSMVSDLETIDGTVTSKSIDARDVTEEYIDLETRMKNKRSYLEQYRVILKGAKTTEDILKVSEEIRQIEEELESVQGRLKYLSDQVALSTLELSLIQTKDYVFKPDRSINFVERLKESLSGGWYGFVNFCLFLLRLWPFLILISVGLVLLRRLSKSGKKPADKSV